MVFEAILANYVVRKPSSVAITNQTTADCSSSERSTVLGGFLGRDSISFTDEIIVT
jgi:hypothetical protein